MHYLLKVKNLVIIAIVAVTACAFASCDRNDDPFYYYDDPYYTGLLGTWDYAYNQYGVISNPYSVDSFAFYNDGTGNYAYYDNYGNWINLAFTWTSYNGNYLEIVYYGGEVQRTYYYFNGRYLVFGDYNTFDGYAPRY